MRTRENGRVLASFLATLALLFAAPLATPADRTPTAWGKILVISTGPEEERIRIKTTFPFYDVGCKSKEHEYTTDPKTPYSRLIHTLVAQALASGNEVQLILDGCYKGLPRIADINVLTTQPK